MFCCLVSSPDVVLLQGGELVQKSYVEVASHEEDFSVSITEDKLWIVLTGYTKKESNIGGHAFDLLLEIAKSKDRGINTKDLAMATNQDPRSITGRIKKLSHLISSAQMIYKGHVVKLLKLQKYAQSGTPVKMYVNMRDHLSEIVQVVKNSKNGVRQIIDLKREFKFDQDKRLSKSFIAAISWLDEKGYLKKVIVVSPTNPSVKIRCVKFIRDYLPEEKGANDFENDSDSGEDEPLGEEKGGMDDDDAFEGLDSFNATSLLQEQNLIVEEQINTGTSDISINRFYPIQNQAYNLADESGLVGISTMQMVSRLTGKDYKRAFTKSSEYYVDNAGSKSKNSSSCGIVKVYDFEGKKKFYRFFTEDNFGKLMDVNHTTKDKNLPVIGNSREDLFSLSKAKFVPLNNTLRFIKDGELDRFFWNGELKVSANPNAPTRGRKRKQQEIMEGEHRSTVTDEVDVKLIKQDARQEDNIVSADRAEDPVHDASTVGGQAPNKDGKLDILTVGGFSAKSLRSLWRQRAILEVVKRAGGVTYLREQFFENVSCFMGSQTMIDKKTVRGDVSLMVQCNKLHEKIEPTSGRRIIFLPDIEDEVVSRYVVENKDNKKAAFADVIHNADLYFFDQTEKNKFHTGVKSAKRVRKFQDFARNVEKEQQQSKESRKPKGRIPTERKQVPKITSARKAEKPRKDVKEGFTSEKQESTKTKGSFHVGNKDGARALIRAVVISKSIKNEIVWEKITGLFPHNSLENLKKQWTVRRVRMGHNGWRAQVDKWQKILLSAIEDEKATLEDAENLDLLKLIGIWKASDAHHSRKPVSLYRDYAENRRCYTFVKRREHTVARVGLAMSSMVQRETYLLNKVYMYDPKEQALANEQTVEDDTRAIIRSILYDTSAIAKDEVSALKTIPKETIDKVILDMAKEKQVYFSGSKLEATTLIQDLLSTEGKYRDMNESVRYKEKLSEMFDAGYGISINSEISDVASWVLIDLISERKLSIDAVTIMEDISPFSYTTRRFGVGALTPPLILSLNARDCLFTKSKQVGVPSGTPNSRLWIDGEGCIRDNVWKALVTMILKQILFSPGISQDDLIQYNNRILSIKEMSEICDWLEAREIIYKMSFKGYGARSQWYRVFD